MSLSGPVLQLRKNATGGCQRQTNPWYLYGLSDWKPIPHLDLHPGLLLKVHMAQEAGVGNGSEDHSTHIPFLASSMTACWGWAL